MADPTTTDVFSAPSESGVAQDPTALTATKPESESAALGSIPAEAAELIGPGKKYADVETALRSIVHAQRHIGTLQAELRALRESSRVAETPEDVLAAINTVNGEGSQTREADPDTVAERVIEKLNKRTKEQKALDNVLSTNAELVKKFGSVKAAQEMVAAKAQELGMSVEDMKRLAGKSPKAVLAHFANVAPVDSPAPSTAGVNSRAAVDQAHSQATHPGTYAWYQQERRKRGDAWYFSEAITKEKNANAIKLGAAFYK